MSAPQPKPLKPQYSFTSFQVNNPTAPPPGDKLDSEYARTAKVISDVIAWVGTSLNSDGSLKTQPRFTPPEIAGQDGTAAASDYATLAGAWAEYMPDTIPPNILAFMDVTGDHWSSRWWANHASQEVQNWQNALPPGPTNTARYVYVATTTQTVFEGPDRNGSTLLLDPSIPQRTQVFRRGLLLTPTDDYNETGVANRITLTQPAVAGDIVQIFVFTLPQAFTLPPFTNSGGFTPPTGANYTLLVQVPGGATITIGNGRVIGQMVTVKDALGTAGSTPITIAAAATIDNNATYTLYSDFASVTLMWLGTLWGTV
jgi:hypothetical protein